MMLAGAGKFVFVVGLVLLQPVKPGDQTDSNKDECQPDYRGRPTHAPSPPRVIHGASVWNFLENPKCRG